MQPRPTTDAQSSAAGGPTMYLRIEEHLRAAGRGLEVLGVIDLDAARLAGVCFRLAQRVAVDSGRLERAA
jgi:hypothetical protein